MNNILKKTLVSFLIFVFMSAQGVCAYNGWADQYLDFCKQRGILQGNSNGDLMPDEYLTKEQMAKILLSTFSVSLDTYSNGYADVEEKTWSYPYVTKFKDFELTTTQVFNPLEDVTRQEFMAMAMKVAGFDSYKIKDINGFESTFADSSEIDSLYYGLIVAGYENKCIFGSNGYIYPDKKLTRAEACALLYSIVNALENKTDDDMYENEYTLYEQDDEAAVGLRPKENEHQDKISENNSDADADEDENADEDDIEILGHSAVTMEQAQKWAKKRGASDLFVKAAEYYWKYDEIMGIRADVMYAQAAKETGFGNYGGRVTADMNNFAGIKKYGATGDEKDDHETFATQEDGVRGHFNHMSAYVGVEPVGETHGRYKSAITLQWAGTVRTVKELGGKWCPNVNYGVELIENFLNTMIEE